jgi:hypothetical protein
VPSWTRVNASTGAEGGAPRKPARSPAHAVTRQGRNLIARTTSSVMSTALADAESVEADSVAGVMSARPAVELLEWLGTNHDCCP